MHAITLSQSIDKFQTKEHFLSVPEPRSTAVNSLKHTELTHLLFKRLTDQDVTRSFRLHLIKDVRFAGSEFGHLVDGATLHDVQHVPKHIH